MMRAIALGSLLAAAAKNRRKNEQQLVYNTIYIGQVTASPEIESLRKSSNTRGEPNFCSTRTAIEKVSVGLFMLSSYIHYKWKSLPSAGVHALLNVRASYWRRYIKLAFYARCIRYVKGAARVRPHTRAVQRLSYFFTVRCARRWCKIDSHATLFYRYSSETSLTCSSHSTCWGCEFSLRHIEKNVYAKLTKRAGAACIFCFK